MWILKPRPAESEDRLDGHRLHVSRLDPFVLSELYEMFVNFEVAFIGSVLHLNVDLLVVGMNGQPSSGCICVGEKLIIIRIFVTSNMEFCIKLSKQFT